MPLEIASFRPDDESCLVLAALSCPICLSSQVDWLLLDTTEDSHVRCSCKLCGKVRVVYLTQSQALRLALAERWPLDLTPRTRALL